MKQLQSVSSKSKENKIEVDSKFYIPSLDGLRAVAFLLVFTAHSGLGEWIPGGSFGVTVFFFMSGYLITTLLRLEYERSERIDFKRFYLSRALRILPLFYCAWALGLWASYSGLLPQPFIELQSTALMAQALHLSNYWIAFQGYDGQVLGTDVFWSLAVEGHFYLLFPLLYSLLLRFRLSPKKQAWTLWGLCLLVLVWRCALVFGFHVTEDRTYMGSDTRFDSILFGCALAVWSNPMLDQKSQLWSDRLWKCLFLPLGLGLLAITVLVDTPEFRDTLRYSFQGIALYPVFVTAIRFPKWGVFRLLNLSWVKTIGILSYALYLTHYTIGYIIVMRYPDLPLVFRVGAMLLLSLMVSLSLHYLIEQPTTLLKKRLKAPPVIKAQ